MLGVTVMVIWELTVMIIALMLIKRIRGMVMIVTMLTVMVVTRR